MQNNRRRAADAITADGHESNRPNIAGSGGIDDVSDARVLHDAAVLDLLESVPAHELGTTSESNSEDRAVQRSKDGLDTIGTKASLPTAIFTAAALILSATIAFASVASRAPGIARILFVFFVVVSPVAVAAVIREEARLRESQNTGPSGPPERS